MFHVLPCVENCVIIGRIAPPETDATLKDAAFGLAGATPVSFIIF